MNRPQFSPPSLRRLHRWLGIASALFVLLLVLTGWMLNHTGELSLDQRPVTATWLLDWYGIHPTTRPLSYPAGPSHLTWLDGRLYLDEKRLSEHAARLVGAVAWQQMLAAATETHLYLLLGDGRLVEKLKADSLVPGTLSGLGRTESGELAVRVDQRAFRLDLDALSGTPVAPGTVDWSVKTPLPETLRERLLQDWRGQGLPLERVIQDLHSGRILGLGGTLFMDLIGLLLAGLAVTGLLIWLRRPG